MSSWIFVAAGKWCGLCVCQIYHPEPWTQRRNPFVHGPERLSLCEPPQQLRRLPLHVSIPPPSSRCCFPVNLWVWFSSQERRHVGRRRRLRPGGHDGRGAARGGAAPEAHGQPVEQPAVLKLSGLHHTPETFTDSLRCRAERRRLSVQSHLDPQGWYMEKIFIWNWDSSLLSKLCIYSLCIKMHSSCFNFG